MKKIISLTESDLVKLVKRVIKEQNSFVPIKIKLLDQKTGEALLVDIMEKTEDERGCLFSGRFRGDYSKLFRIMFGTSFNYSENVNILFNCSSGNNEVKVTVGYAPEVSMNVTDAGKKLLEKKCGCNKYVSNTTNSPETSSGTYV
jgi:hypothetical protein